MYCHPSTYKLEHLIYEKWTWSLTYLVCKRKGFVALYAVVGSRDQDAAITFL